jgi:glycerol-3-phosphate dehydrogenase (NAD(P)+)
MAKIAVIGAGAWGTTMANSLCKNGNDVKIWAYEKEVAEEINESLTNTRYLYGVWFCNSILASNNLSEVVKDAEFVIYATPSFALKDIVKQTSNYINNKAIPVFLTKGFIDSNNEIPKLPLCIANEDFQRELKNKSVYLSGPSHAEEVAREKYTGLIAASDNRRNAIRVRDIVSTEHLSVYVSFDPIGVQVSAALKNVVAIAFGLADAMREYDKSIGDNAFAMIISTGLNEIQTVGTALGSTHPETFTSISAVGDLYVTCTSHHGRNRRFGRDLLERQLYRAWEDFPQLLEKLDIIGYLPEGIFAVKYAMVIKEKFNLKLPIMEIVYRILNRDIKPSEAVGMLMNVVGKE